MVVLWYVAKYTVYFVADYFPLIALVWHVPICNQLVNVRSTTYELYYHNIRVLYVLHRIYTITKAEYSQS